MTIQLQQTILDSILGFTHAQALKKLDSIQTLWSGYGEIARYQLTQGAVDSVVVKHVTLPDFDQESSRNHPRGWNTELSHKRKVRSYQVESNWYQNYSYQCTAQCQVPKVFGVEQQGDQYIMVLEDLDAIGYSARVTSATLEHMQICLTWLAYFHCQFLIDTNQESLADAYPGLWETGCYWHLATRPDELEALEEKPLKAAAQKIDQLLSNSRYQTLVHGDAKLANFCFSKIGDTVAAVDFQYVGGGCGMKDVAYFMGSCLDAEGCERYCDRLLEYYFDQLKMALVNTGKDSEIGFDDLKSQWKQLFPIAWADFHRFMKGWYPDHWKINSFSESLTKRVLKEIHVDNFKG